MKRVSGVGRRLKNGSGTVLVMLARRHQAMRASRTIARDRLSIGSYHQIFQIAKSFRMAKSDLQALPSTTATATRAKPT